MEQSNEIFIAESITKKHRLDDKISAHILNAVKRILAINEENTFAYQDLAQFEKSLPK
ncbi:MAG: hypothetical protein HW420_1162, partial [Candidatus Nitrosotenuis sp.]|nr:hypothetical protein [Candidatus Nitrosotenuis sp.]